MLDVVHLREAMYGKRLEYQARNATRRLQELIYECLGEYDKTHRRAMGRTAFLHSDSENQVGGTRWWTVMCFTSSYRHGG